MPPWWTPHERVRGRADAEVVADNAWVVMFFGAWLLEGGLEATPSIGAGLEAVFAGAWWREPEICRVRTTWQRTGAPRVASDTAAFRILLERYASCGCHVVLLCYGTLAAESWWRAWAIIHGLDPLEGVRWHLRGRCRNEVSPQGQWSLVVALRCRSRPTCHRMVALLRPIEKSQPHATQPPPPRRVAGHGDQRCVLPYPGAIRPGQSDGSQGSGR